MKRFLRVILPIIHIICVPSTFSRGIWIRYVIIKPSLVYNTMHGTYGVISRPLSQVLLSGLLLPRRLGYYGVWLATNSGARRFTHTHTHTYGGCPAYEALIANVSFPTPSFFDYNLLYVPLALSGKGTVKWVFIFHTIWRRIPAASAAGLCVGTFIEMIN